MRATVPDEILKKTTKCASNFACLTTALSSQYPSCCAETSRSEKVLYVKPKLKPKHIIHASCSYMMSFGFGDPICQCPTYNALIKRSK
jgi:hypothetical protein